ncbi:7-cyano-7-deazaguanine synthase [Streptomyces sp. NPDC091272]|uniref:7-cyano-7-deazaguanine synthase n=1 Tax=Streptomyces sp. NPDC091272 TaxID=3365981 RepID=UPI0037F81FF1
MTPARPLNSFWWLGHSSELPPAPIWLPIGTAGFQEIEGRISGHHSLRGSAPAWADDLLRLSRAVFLADKLASREATEDRWTRRLRLSVPVSDPDRWAAAADVPLPSLLRTLTGDLWEISLRPLRSAPRQEPFPADAEWCAREVALFSGGLDSLSWAARRAAETGADDGVLLLVSFSEKKVEHVLRNVSAGVEALARRSGRELRRLTLAQTNSSVYGKVAEHSSRPRGLLYAATAIRAAAANHVDTVQVPENGQLALNPPLSAARSAALSTRSVHPRTLSLLNEVIRTVGGSVTVENPLAHLTKGEVCRAAVRAGLPLTVMAQSMSCGAPPRQRRAVPYVNCGVCFPCLVRRSGLLAGTGTDPTPYETTPRHPGLSSERSEHWHALRNWLDRDYTVFDLIGDVPLPPGTSAGTWLQVIESGREELRAMVRWVESEVPGAA